MNIEHRARTYIQRFKAEMKADPKRTGVMIVLLTVAAVMGTKMFLARPGPQSAQAAPDVLPAAVADPREATPTMDSSQAQRAALDAYLAQVESTVSRDLFDLQLESYELTELALSEQSQEKSVRKQADDAAVLARKQAEQQIRRLAENLKLQSTMPGPSPSAIINGQVVGQGDSLEGFTITQIGRGSCLVRQSDVDVMLYMEQ